MKTISLSLNHNSIENVIAELEKRKAESISRNILTALLQIGIRVAEENTGKFAGYISFSAYVEKGDVGHIGWLVAKDRQQIKSGWWKNGEWKEVNISPLLMSEFGSGWFAEVPNVWSSLNGIVGQGTFKDGDYVQKHAFDPDGWTWTDESGYHKSYGEHPTYPMLSAWMAMKTAIEETARNEIADFL